MILNLHIFIYSGKIRSFLARDQKSEKKGKICHIYIIGPGNPVSGQNVAQLSEFRRFVMLFVLPRVSTSKKIWVDNFLCMFKPVTTPFSKRGKNLIKMIEI